MKRLKSLLRRINQFFCYHHNEQLICTYEIEMTEEEILANGVCKTRNQYYCTWCGRIRTVDIVERLPKEKINEQKRAAL